MLKKLTEDYIKAFSARDLKALSSMLTDDFVLEDPVVKHIEGKELALSTMKNMFESCIDLDFRGKNIYQEGNTTLIEFTLKMDAIVLEGVDIIEWSGERIKQLRAYLDIPKG